MSVLNNFAKFTGKHLFQCLFLNKVAGLGPENFSKKGTLAQAFSCEFCEIFENTFFLGTPPIIASRVRNRNTTWICLNITEKYSFWHLKRNFLRFSRLFVKFYNKIVLRGVIKAVNEYRSFLHQKQQWNQ